MSFADPTPITISGTPHSLAQLEPADSEGNPARYSNPDGTVVMLASHQEGKRNRRMVKVTVSKIAPDAFRPAENVRVSMSCHVVFDVKDGYTVAEQKAVFDGFFATLNATSGAMVTKLLQGES
jgi:hypothetical protein